MQRNSEIIEQLKQTLLIYEENQKILEIGEQKEKETVEEYIDRIEEVFETVEENTRNMKNIIHNLLDGIMEMQ